MTVAFDAVGPSSTGQTSTTSANLTWTHTAGAGGSCVLVYLSVGFAAAVSAGALGSFSSVTYGGSAMTLLGSKATGTGTQGGIFCYGITGAASGANTVTFSGYTPPSGATVNAAIGVSVSATGGGSFGTPVTVASAGAVTTGTLTIPSTTSGGLVVAGFADGSGTEAFTAGTQQWKEDLSSSSAAGCQAGATIASTGGSTAVSWTQASDWWGAVGVEILPAGGGGGGASAAARFLPRNRYFRAHRILGRWRPRVAPPSSLGGIGPAPYLILSSGLTSGSTSYPVLVTTATTAGDGVTVVVAAGGAAAPAVSSVTDSQGNSYTIQEQFSSSSPILAVATSAGGIALSTSDTITVTFASAATGGISVLAAGAPGMTTIDINTAPANGSSASPAISGTPAADGEIVLACFAWANAAGAGSVAAPFAQLAQQHPASGTWATIAYDSSPVSGALLTANASITSASWRAVMISWAPSAGTAVPDADQAGAADTATVSVDAVIAETAGATDGLTVAATVSLAETAGAAEQAAPAAAVPPADSAGAAEAISIAISQDVSLADQAGAAEALSPAASVPLSEAAGSADKITVTAAIPLSDTAGAADSSPPAAATPLPELGAAADTISVVQGISVAEADTAGAAESVTVQAATPLPDTSGAVDTLAVSVAVALADSAAAAETTPRETIETAGAADQLAAAAAVPLPEQAGAAEALSPAATLGLAETAGAADAISVLVGNIASLPDAAGATEKLTVTVTGPEGEAGAVTDALTATASAPLADVAGAIEGLSVVASNQAAVAETAGTIESVSLAASTQVADQAAGADLAAVAASIPVPDAAGAADQLSVVTSSQPALSETAGAAEQIAVVQTAVVADGELAGAADALHVTVAVALAEQAGSSEQPAGIATAGLAEAAGAADSLLVVSSTAQSGRVQYRVQPAPPRWKARPEPSRWHAQPARLRWETRPGAARWSAGPERPRWKAMLENFKPIPAISLEEINVRWTSDLDGTSVDPTITPLAVQFAFPASSGSIAAPTQPATWLSGTWLPGGTGKGYVAQCLVGPSGGAVTLTAGKYDVWSKIIGSPESPARFAGVLTVY